MTKYQPKEYNIHYFYFRFTMSNGEKYIFLFISDATPEVLKKNAFTGPRC